MAGKAIQAQEDILRKIRSRIRIAGNYQGSTMYHPLVTVV